MNYRILCAANLFAAAPAWAVLAVVEPDHAIWPWLLLAGLVAAAAGLVVLRIKRPDTFARIMREGKRVESRAEGLAALLEQAKKSAMEVTHVPPHMIVRPERQPDGTQSIPSTPTPPQYGDGFLR